MTKLPRGAKLIGTANPCKNAAFIIGDTVFAVQGHPEFDVHYTNALIGLLADRAGESAVKAARKSLSTPHDGIRIANWILAFFLRQKSAQSKIRKGQMPHSMSNLTKRKQQKCHW